MKRLVTFATVLLVGLASVQAAQTDDQQKKKKKQTQSAQATPAPTPSRTQASRRHVSTQTSNQRVSSQTSKKHISSQTSSNQQATSTYSKKKHSNAETAANYNQQNVQRTKKSKQTNVVVNNNAYVNKKAYKHFKRTGNEVSFSVARAQIVRTHHDRSWWNQHYSRIVFYGGGYWYWNAGWWYPAWGYNPYYSSYIYDGPIYGYGYASPGDVTAEVQRALAVRGYYYGPIDGILGSRTRSAIRRYQIDRGLYVTAAIDEPTLATLGLT
jgi:Putative peptidoglycan binding domain